MSPGPLNVPLLGDFRDRPPQAAAAPRGLARTWAVVALICISVGVMHPIATEASKSAKIFTCQMTKDRGVQCTRDDPNIDQGDLIVRRGMPFHPATLTLVAELVAVVLTYVVVSLQMGWRAASRKLLDPAPLVRMAPVGCIYGLGDFMQTMACNAASAPVVLVMGQSKLLLTALFSKWFLTTGQQTDWNRLLVISCAAAASTNISAEAAASAMMRSDELFGGFLALSKAALSSAGAVLSEKDYKRDSESFWVLSFRVQFLMLTASLAMTPFTCRGLLSMSFPEIFFGGPGELCSEGEVRCDLAGAEQCTCMDRRGWDINTMLAVSAIVVNGFSTGLTLRHLSAITKSVCGALSTQIVYVGCVLLGYRKFQVSLALVLAIVAIESHQYAMQKSRRAERRRHEKLSLPVKVSGA